MIDFKKHKKGFIVLLILIIAVTASFVYSLIDGIHFNKSFQFNTPRFDFSFGTFKNTKKVFPKIGKNYIAVINIEGVIEQKNKTYDQEWLLDTITQLKDDPKNKAILLNINSPGGGVFEADEVYFALMDYKQSGKKIWAYFEQIAASGGYYIACAADTIYANRNTITGSIGVLFGPVFDLSDFLKKYDIKMTTFTSGKNKNMLNLDSPITPEQRVIMQSIVDEAYNQFAEIVALARKMPIEQVKKAADGRIYTALQAKEAKLIDEVARFDVALENMKETLLDECGNLSDEYFEPTFKQTFYEMLQDVRFLFKGLKMSESQNIIQTIETVLNQSEAKPQYR